MLFLQIYIIGDLLDYREFGRNREWIKINKDTYSLQGKIILLPPLKSWKKKRNLRNKTSSDWNPA